MISLSHYCTKQCWEPSMRLRIGAHSLGSFFRRGTLLFVGQNEANVSLAAEPTAPRRRAANRASQNKLLTGHAAATQYIDHPPRFILGILRARDIGQAGVAGMTGPSHKGAQRWSFCLFEERGEEWVNHYPAAAMGFRIEPPKAVPSASSGALAAAGGAGGSPKWLACYRSTPTCATAR